MQKMTSAKMLAALPLVALVAGCATTATKLPDYNPSASAVSQADNFIMAKNEKHMKGVGKVGVTSCNVMFGMTSAASASTSGGIFSDTGDTRRVDTRVTVTYTMKGIEESELQRWANAACDNAEKQLASSGFEVVPHATIKANEHYQAFHKGGRASPFEYKGGGDTRYLVLAREGETISDTRYIGTARGLGQAFKAAAGNSSEQHEGRLIKELGMTAVNINILIDFAEMKSDGHKTFGGLGNKDSANVNTKVQLAARGDLRFKPVTKQKCWKRFGKEECMINYNQQPVFATSRAVATNAPFYRSIDNVTTTGDKITAGVSKALATFSALGGVSSSSVDITRYQVNVVPTSYKTEQEKLSGGLVSMAAAKATRTK